MTPSERKTPIRLLLAGDAMLGRGVNETILQRRAGYPLEPLRDITRGADLFLANLECAFASRDRRWSGAAKAFYFRADPVAADVLVGAGVDGVSLANNHALDADFAGLSETLQILQREGIHHAGAGEDAAEAVRATVMESGGQALALIAACDHQEDFAAGPQSAGIYFINLRDADSGAVDGLASRVADWAAQVNHVIVSLHWQSNWAPVIEPRYRMIARQLADAGARVIWGHSPHHFQGVEFLGSSAVLYSTGDFVDDYAVDPFYRNDRQFLFEVYLGDSGVEGVRVLPLELSFARTALAGPEAREWLATRFRRMCQDTGSRVEGKDETWWRVLPDG